VKKKYVVRSTKETNRIEAIEVAEEILETYKSKQNSSHATSKDCSFEYYAKLLADLNAQKSKSPRNKYTERDQNKLLFQEREGLISYFGKYDVGKITSGNGGVKRSKQQKHAVSIYSLNLMNLGRLKKFGHWMTKMKMT
jgi:hypothetical protein